MPPEPYWYCGELAEWSSAVGFGGWGRAPRSRMRTRWACSAGSASSSSRPLAGRAPDCGKADSRPRPRPREESALIRRDQHRPTNRHDECREIDPARRLHRGESATAPVGRPPTMAVPHDPGASGSGPRSRYPTCSALLAQLVEHLHGKEGVDGSSPLEGFSERPANVGLSSSRPSTSSRPRVPNGYDSFFGSGQNGHFLLAISERRTDDATRAGRLAGSRPLIAAGDEHRRHVRANSASCACSSSERAHSGFVGRG